MNEKLNRRELILAGAAAGLTAAAPRTLFGQAPAVIAPEKRQAGRHLLGQRQRLQERRRRDRRPEGLRHDHPRLGRARRPGRRSEHPGARSGRGQRRLRRPAERRGRRAARLLLHARAAAAGWGRGGARRRAARRRWSPRPSWSRPITTSWSARARRTSPAAWGSRSRTTSTPRSPAASGSTGSAGSIPAITSIRRSAPRPDTGRRSRWPAKGSSAATTSGARSTATVSTPRARSAA